MKTKYAEFQIQDMLPIAMTLVVTGIGVAFGLNVMSDVRDDFVTQNSAANCGLNSTGGTGGTIGYSACGIEYNATGSAIEGVAKIPEKMPLIATVIVAALLIGILVRYLFVKFG